MKDSEDCHIRVLDQSQLFWQEANLGPVQTSHCHVDGASLERSFKLRITRFSHLSVKRVVGVFVITMKYVGVSLVHHQSVF